jgi:hypothetical protein
MPEPFVNVQCGNGHIISAGCTLNHIVGYVIRVARHINDRELICGVCGFHPNDWNPDTARTAADLMLNAEDGTNYILNVGTAKYVATGGKTDKPSTESNVGNIHIGASIPVVTLSASSMPTGLIGGSTEIAKDKLTVIPPITEKPITEKPTVIPPITEKPITEKLIMEKPIEESKETQFVKGKHMIDWVTLEGLDVIRKGKYYSTSYAIHDLVTNGLRLAMEKGYDAVTVTAGDLRAVPGIESWLTNRGQWTHFHTHYANHMHQYYNVTIIDKLTKTHPPDASTAIKITLASNKS